MAGLLHAMAFMTLLLVGWVIWNNKPLPLRTALFLQFQTAAELLWFNSYSCFERRRQMSAGSLSGACNSGLSSVFIQDVNFWTDTNDWVNWTKCLLLLWPHHRCQICFFSKKKKKPRSWPRVSAAVGTANWQGREVIVDMYVGGGVWW